MGILVILVTEIFSPSCYPSRLTHVYYPHYLRTIYHFLSWLFGPFQNVRCWLRTESNPIFLHEKTSKATTKKEYQRTIDFIKCSQRARNGALALCSYLLSSLDFYLKATMLVLPILVMNRLRSGQAIQGLSLGWTLRRSVLTFICL